MDIKLPAGQIIKSFLCCLSFIVFSTNVFGRQTPPKSDSTSKYGDLRISHFVGMHALQVLPLMAYYLLRDIKLVIISGLVYGALALFCLVQALNSKPLLSL